MRTRDNVTSGSRLGWIRPRGRGLLRLVASAAAVAALLVGVFTAPAREFGYGAHTYHTRTSGYEAVAYLSSYGDSDCGGWTSNEVRIDVVHESSSSNQGASESDSLYLNVNEYKYCVDGYWNYEYIPIRIINGYIGLPSDTLQIDRRLDLGTLGTITGEAYDEVAGTMVPIELDAVWTGFGDAVRSRFRDSYSYQYGTGSYRSTNQGSGLTRDAEPAVSLSIDGQPVDLPEQSVSGRLYDTNDGEHSVYHVSH